MNRQALPDIQENKYAILNADTNSVAEFDGDSDTSKGYNELLKDEDQNGWWDSMKQDFHEM
jgi:hypothetical protein